MEAIWKDYVDLIAVADAAFYDISYVKGGEEISIYRGKAQPRPGEERVYITINDVCADFLKNTLPNISASFTPAELPVTFVIRVYDDEDDFWEYSASVQFLMDWSYNPNHDPLTDGLAHPINGRVDARQAILYTALNEEALFADVTLKNGDTFQVIIPVAITADFNADYNDDFAKSLRSAGSGTAVFDLSEIPNIDKVVIKGVEYKVANSCARYVLYYLNAYGGWDAFLIEGSHKELDQLTRESFNRAGEQINYRNEIKKTIELNTWWLSDAQSLKMHHLLNSTSVYLHDLQENEVIPVVLENTTTEYKTYLNQGGRLVNYKINVAYSHKRQRK